MTYQHMDVPTRNIPGRGRIPSSLLLHPLRVAVGGPEERVHQQAAEVVVLEVFRDAEGRVNDAAAVVHAGEGDGLSIFAVVAGLKNNDVFQQVAAFVELSADEGADAAEYGMLGLVGLVRDLDRLVGPVALVRAPKDLTIEDVIVRLLEGVAGGANSDDRPAGFPVGADRLHLVIGQVHPAGEDQQEVGVFQRVEVLQGLTAVGAPGGWRAIRKKSGVRLHGI
jgi:hypothetical protein